MSKELNKSICIKNIHALDYKANPSLFTSGRYIKSLHHLQLQISDENDKLECQYLINKCLSAHIIYLQEAIMNSFNVTFKTPTISKDQATNIKQLAKSEYAINDGKYSLVDIDDLKTIKMLKRSVKLSKDLVLPCKVKSSDKKYNFNTQILVSESNVLSYASYGFDPENDTKNVYHNTLITKSGKGMQDSISKARTTNVTR